MEGPRDPFDDPPKDAREALADLVQQIEAADFADPLGHPLRMNAAFLNAKALLSEGEAEARARPGDVPPEYRTWETGP